MNPSFTLPPPALSLYNTDENVNKNENVLSSKVKERVFNINQTSTTQNKKSILHLLEKNRILSEINNLNQSIENKLKLYL